MAYDEDEPEPITEPDTENSTHFHAKDADNFQREDGTESNTEKLQRLSKLNTGMWNGKWENKKELHRQDNLHRLDAIANYIELTDYQHRRSRKLFDEFPLGTFGYENDIVAFSICVLVAREDGRKFDPAEKVGSEEDLDSVETDELFHRFALEQGFRYGRLETVINKIRDRGWKWGWW